MPLSQPYTLRLAPSAPLGLLPPCQALEMVVSHPEYAAKMNVSNARNRADLAAAAAAAVSAATPTLGLGAEADDESDYDADDAAAAEMEQADDDGADDEPSTRKKTTAESQAEALKLRATIRSDDFWEDSSEVLELFSLLLYYLRVVDESNRSVMGWIWPMMYSLQKKMKAKLLVGDYTGRMPLREREAAVEYIDERWAYLHVPMHSAAFCVNPRFHGINHFEDMEVRDDFVSVVSDMLGDAHEAKVLEVITEYEAYHQKTGAWSSPLCWHDYKTVEPLTFWKRWKANSPLLAPLASRWLSAAHAAGAAERNFSLHKRHNSALRASQKPDTLARLVRLCDSQTALDKANERNADSRRERQRAEAGKPPLARKSYPLEAESDWSTVDESDGEEQEVGAVIGEAVPASLTGRLRTEAEGAARAAARDAAAQHAVAAAPRAIATEQPSTRAAPISTADRRARPPPQQEHRTGAAAAAGSRHATR